MRNSSSTTPRTVRAVPRRQQQPRLPRLLRAAGGARHERGHAHECAARVHEHAVQASHRLPPKGVAVAWDTRPVERMELDDAYKSDRRPMADLLREQFHFRPIVEAFGYRNLEFEGWEADDVIATLATRADQAGIKTTVVSTDRDAFQLVSDNVVLMMTPRGSPTSTSIRPSRSRRGSGSPRADPRFHRAQGRHLRQHPRCPGDRRQDRVAADQPVRVARGRARAHR